MKRRQFLQFAAITPALAIPMVGNTGPDAKTLGFVRPPSARFERDVERLIAATASKEFVQFEGWNVLWTGWKASQLSIDIAHQWAMRPVKPFGLFLDDPHVLFYISMPGGTGLLQRGEAMELDYHWQQVGYGADSIAYGWEHPEAIWANAQGVTARLSLEVMRGAVDFDGPLRELEAAFNGSSWSTRTNPKWRYEALTGPSAFYVDPDRYMLENYYRIAAEPEDYREARYGIGRDLFLRLYGAERALYDAKTQDAPAWPVGIGTVEERRLRLAEAMTE